MSKRDSKVGQRRRGHASGHEWSSRRAGSRHDRRAGASVKRPLGRRPLLRFFLVFALCMSGFYGLSATAWFERWGWVPYLELNARISGAILGAFGETIAVSGRALSSPRAALAIERGCDAIHPTLLFLAAVLALPAAWGRKLAGILAGSALLALLNLMRIVTLYYVRADWPKLFDVMHLEVWQATFIGIALALWIIWALWATRAALPEHHAAS